MALDISKSIEFTDDEIATILNHLDSVEEIFKEKMIQLTPKESQYYGRLGNETEALVKEINQDIFHNWFLLPTHIDKDIWLKNNKTREVLNAFAIKLANLNQQVLDSNRKVGFSISKMCTAIYRNAKNLTLQNVVGYKLFFEKWRVHYFNRRPNKNKQIKEGVIE
jgi:hypothetical protein